MTASDAGAARRTRERPTPLNAGVTAQMKRMPRHSTGPELLLRRELHRLGLRYRVHPRDLPGRPDVAFTRLKIAVFVDGCFWHACPQHGTLPKNNRVWWQQKLDANVARDRRVDSRLAEEGWRVVRVWEHDEPLAAATMIRTVWVEQRSRPARHRRSR